MGPKKWKMNKQIPTLIKINIEQFVMAGRAEENRDPESRRKELEKKRVC